MEHQDLKRCTSCKKLKLISNFYKKGSRYDSRCKNCILKMKKEKKKKIVKNRRFEKLSSKISDSYELLFMGCLDKKLLAAQIFKHVEEVV